MMGARVAIVAAVIFVVFPLAWYFTGQVVAQGEGTRGGNTTPAKTPIPPPKTPPPPPPKASPSPPPKSDGALMNAGAPKNGPVPRMPDGRCPDEFPKESGEACFK
jgi:hypothetical protein